MNSSLELANRFREVIFDGTWIADTNYNQQLTTSVGELQQLELRSLIPLQIWRNAFTIT